MKAQLIIKSPKVRELICQFHDISYKATITHLGGKMSTLVFSSVTSDGINIDMPEKVITSTKIVTNILNGHYDATLEELFAKVLKARIKRAKTLVKQTGKSAYVSDIVSDAERFLEPDGSSIPRVVETPPEPSLSESEPTSQAPSPISDDETTLKPDSLSDVTVVDSWASLISDIKGG